MEETLGAMKPLLVLWYTSLNTCLLSGVAQLAEQGTWVRDPESAEIGLDDVCAPFQLFYHSSNYKRGPLHLCFASESPWVAILGNNVINFPSI